MITIKNARSAEYTDRLFRKELTATFDSLGKARNISATGKVIDGKAINAKELSKREVNRLYRKIDKINTAFDFRQGDNGFYISVLRSVGDKVLNPRVGCTFNLKVILVETRIKDDFYYSIILESMSATTGKK